MFIFYTFFKGYVITFSDSSCTKSILQLPLLREEVYSVIVFCVQEKNFENIQSIQRYLLEYPL